MNKLITAFFLLAAISGGIFAQTSGVEYNKNEFYVGYTNQQVSREINMEKRRSLNGIEASYVRNFHRYFGLKGDFSAAYQKGNTNGLVVLGNSTMTGSLAQVNYDFNTSVYNFLGGVQVKDNASQGRFKPFAHALVGAAHTRNKTKNLGCVSNCPATLINIPDFNSIGTNFAGAFGGGIDVKINDKIDFRAVQVDYNPVFSGSRKSNNFRFGIGVVFK